MRWVAVGLVPLVLAGCGAKYKPAGPVMSGYERAIKFPVHRPHDGLVYSGRDPATTAPVIPVMAFGAAFDLDVALMPRDGDFDMIEFARLNTPQGYTWLALETSATSGDQTILANVDDIDSMMPELPLARRTVDTFTVTDNSTETTVSIDLAYDNSVGDRVEAEILGDPPVKPAKKRNGRTFDHSENQLLAVLDVASSESLFKANVQVGGKGLKLKKVGGIVPARFVLDQTQGGLAVATYQLIPDGPAAGGADYGDIVVRGASPDPASNDEQPVSKPPPELQVRMAVAKNHDTIKACYARRLGEQADVAGRMQFDFQVEAGVVTTATVATIEAEDALVDEALGNCVVEAIKDWKIDESVTGSVSWPFTFVAPAEEGADGEVKIGEGAAELQGAEAPAPEDAPANDEKLGDEDLLEGVSTDGAERPDAEDLGEEDPDGEAAAPAELPPSAISNFATIHKMPSGSEVEMKWLVSRKGDRVTAVQSSDLRTLTYNYRLVADNYLELVSITVDQYGRATPVTAITFNPPLPDVRWPFNGRRVSDMVIDVNGQQNHAYGQVDVYWSEAGPKLKVTPIEPKWAANRVMQTSIIFQEGAANIAIERIGE